VRCGESVVGVWEDETPTSVCESWEEICASYSDVMVFAVKIVVPIELEPEGEEDGFTDPEHGWIETAVFWLLSS